VKRVLRNRIASRSTCALALSLALVVIGCKNSSYAAPPDTVPPTAPAGLTTTPFSDTQINLAWTASTDNVGVTGYRVERCQGANCANFAPIAAPTATTFNDTGLTPSTSYSYRVRATDAAGNLSSFSSTSSATSSKDTTPPSIPANLATIVISSSQINLSWTASTDDVAVTVYNVQRCQGPACANFAPIGAPTTSTTFNDTGLTAFTSYSYRVDAADAAGNLSPFSATVTTSTEASGPVAVSISPKRAAVTTSQSQTFSATVTGSTNTSVTWAVDTIPNGSPTVGTIDANGKYTPPAAAGTHTVSAASVADITKNATAPIAVTDLTGVFTYHNDLSRDGANTHEFALTTSTVTVATFGKLFSCTTDGAVYAQPLWVPNLTIGAAKHNVIFVATQHESLYAFDADSNASPCVPLWHANLMDAAYGGTSGETSVPSGHIGGLVGNGFGDIEAEVGITGTPVIDPSTNTLYVVSKSVNASTQFFQRLHALDLTTGSEKLNGNKPILISASVPGDGDGSSGGTVTFDPRNQHQRPGLALVNGVIYVAWASHEDHDPYHGWVVGYNASTLAQVPGAVFNTTPNHVGTVSYSRGGVWMGGGAPAADASNNLYFITGNGTYDGLNNFGDSILRLSTSGGLSATDWFTPNDQAMLDQNDTDLGSGASTILVDLPLAPVHQLLIGGGKEGTLYLLDRTSLGHFTPNNSGVVQSFPASNGIFATPAFWQNKLYYAADGDALKMFTLDPAMGMFTPIAGPSATSHSTNSFGFPGSTPSVSASGVANGIIWALDNSQYGFPAGTNGPAVLHAYDATNLASELWNSSQGTGNGAGNAVKFTVPTVANGKVYIGTRTELDVYGLKPN
jgi:chitodextrinase